MNWDRDKMHQKSAGNRAAPEDISRTLGGEVLMDLRRIKGRAEKVSIEGS